MKYAINIASRKQSGSISAFIIDQLTRHFRAWAQEDPGSSFDIRWVKKRLVLETDSPHLVQQWQQSERYYVNYLMSPAQDIDFSRALGSVACSTAA